MLQVTCYFSFNLFLVFYNVAFVFRQFVLSLDMMTDNRVTCPHAVGASKSHTCCDDL